MQARGSHPVSHPTWQGVLAGAAGGFVAAWAMEQVQQRLSHAVGDRADHAQRASGRARAWDARTQDQLSGQPRSATEQAVLAGSRATGVHFDPSARASTAQALHYAFGLGAGAAYGALADVDPRVTRMGGLAFGLAVWASADEVSAALARLAPDPADRPPLAHAYSLLSHAVYGLTTEAVRKTVRAAFASG
jgi:uncharacterized membrane protein YagU involved in acid resistance